MTSSMPNTVEIDVRANDETKGFAGIKAGLEKSLGGLKGLAVAAGADIASSLAGPLVAGAGVAVAAFASVGAAVGAFGAAVAPQLGKVTEATDLYAKAQKSAAAGSASAAKDMEAYKKSLAQLPPATRATAVAFIGLKNDFQKWSDSLAPKTMPIFTKGIGVLRTLLPSLTPLVNVAADSLNKFMGVLQKDASGGGVQKFIGKLSESARVVLPAMLMSLRNLAIGFGGIISAFLPFSGSLGNGMEKLTKKFADFGRSLGTNSSFVKFMDDVRAKGPGLFLLLENLAKSVLAIATALAPFSGLTLLVAEAFAKLIAAIPQDVMNWLAPAIAGIVLGIKAWAVVQGILNVVMAANPIAIVVLAIAGLAAGLIYAYKHSATFRDVVNSAWSTIRTKVSDAWGIIQPIFKKFAGWFKDAKVPIGEFVDFIKTDVVGIIQDLAGGISGIGDSVKNLPDQFNSLKSLGGGLKGKGADDKKDGALDAVTNAIEMIVKKIKSIISGLGRWIGDNWWKPWRKVTDFMADFWAILAGICVGGLKVVVHAILSPWPGLQKRWDKATRGLATSVAHRVHDIVMWFGTLPSQIARVANRMWNSVPHSLSGMMSTVKGMLRGFGSWIADRLASIKSSIASFAMGAIPGFAHGGVVGAAGGGPRSGLIMVGEQGRELIRVPSGSTVIPNGQTESMMNSSGGGVAKVQLEWVGGNASDSFMTWLQNNIRARAGSGPDSVQRALGKR